MAYLLFEAGLLKPCHLIDSLPQGGQLTEIYPKAIYDIWISIHTSGELVDNLMQQIEPFKPGFTLGERAESIERFGGWAILPNDIKKN